MSLEAILESKMTKVHKIVAYFIDHENYGADEYKHLVEWNASGHVIETQTVDIGGVTIIH